MGERRNLQRREFVEKYFPYIRNMIIKMGRRFPPGIEFNDLLNSAVIGLITSIDRYDPKKGIKFTTFAQGRIRGEILDSFRKNDKLSRHFRKLINRYEKANDELRIKNKSEPNFDEITSFLNLNKSQIRSLSILIPFNNYLDHQINEIINDPDELIEKINDKIILQIKIPEALKQLDKNEENVIISYFYNNETLKQIGERLELTESRISQIKKSAIKKLKKKLELIKLEL